MLLQATAINRRIHGDVHPEVAINLNNLGLVKRDHGELDAAEEYLRQAVALDTSLDRQDHQLHATHLVNLGSVLALGRKLHEAESAFEQAKAIQLLSFLDDSWQVAQSDTFLAGVLTSLGRYEEAEALLLRSYPILKERFGTEHDRTQGAVDRLVRLYEALGEAETATAYRKEQR